MEKRFKVICTPKAFPNRKTQLVVWATTEIEAIYRYLKWHPVNPDFVNLEAKEIAEAMADQWG